MNNNKIALRYAPLLLIVAIGFSLYGRLVCGQMVFITDVLAYQLPEKEFIRECFLSGIVPFLNPYILAGSQFYANIDAGVMNPMNIMLLAGNQLDGFNLFILAHYILAMLSMYLLLKYAFRLNIWIALIGGVAYGEGYLWSMAGNSFFRCGFLIPLFFLFLIKYLGSLKSGISGNKRIIFIVNVMILSLLFYSGNFLEAYFTMIFSGIMIFFYSLHLYSSGNRMEIRKILVGSIIAIITAVLIASPMLLPVITASFTSYRADGIPIIEAQQWSFPPIRIIEYLIPFLFGSRQNDGIWYDSIYKVEETFSKTGLSPWADFVYLGIPLLLGILLFIRYKKDWKAKFLVVSLILAICLALGKFTPVYELFYYILPGFKMFRHPEKFIFWVNFWLIVAGSIGLQFLLSEKERALKYVDKILKISIIILISVFLLFLSFFMFLQEYTIKFIQERGSMWNGDEIFMWETFAIGLSVTVVLILLASVRLIKSPARILASFFILTVLNFAIWQYIIEWTIPVRDFKNIRTWDEKLPVFDKSIWRVFSAGKFQYPSDVIAAQKDAFKIRKLMEYATLDCNAPGLRKLRTVSGFSPTMDKNYVNYMNFERHEPERVLDLLSVRYVAARKIPEGALPKGSNIIYTDKDRDFMILENTDALPRIKTYSEYVQAEKDKVEEIVFRAGRMISANFVLVDLPENYQKGIKCSNDSSAEIVEENPNNIKIRVQNGPCWIVLRDWFNAGWSCREGNKNIQILQADGGLMAVFCDSKDIIMEFKYCPPGLKQGIVLMAIGFLIIAAYGAIGGKRHP